MAIHSYEDWEGMVSRPPFVMDWPKGNGLPQRLLKPRGRHPQLPFYLAAPPHFATGAADAPFDFSGHMLRLCCDIAAWCEELQQFDVSQVLFTVLVKVGLLQQRVDEIASFAGISDSLECGKMR